MFKINRKDLLSCWIYKAAKNAKYNPEPLNRIDIQGCLWKTVHDNVVRIDVEKLHLISSTLSDTRTLHGVDCVWYLFMSIPVTVGDFIYWSDPRPDICGK